MMVEIDPHIVRWKVLLAQIDKGMVVVTVGESEGREQNLLAYFAWEAEERGLHFVLGSRVLKVEVVARQSRVIKAGFQW